MARRYHSLPRRGHALALRTDANETLTWAVGESCARAYTAPPAVLRGATNKPNDANTVEETDHRGGKVTDEIRLATSKDGKTLEVTDKDVVQGQTTTLTFEKQ